MCTCMYVNVLHVCICIAVGMCSCVFVCMHAYVHVYACVLGRTLTSRTFQSKNDCWCLLCLLPFIVFVVIPGPWLLFTTVPGPRFRMIGSVRWLLSSRGCNTAAWICTGL